jgi:hypothetical protein
MWLVFFGLGVAFVLISHQGFLALLYIFFSQGNAYLTMAGQLLDKLYFLVAGVGLMILVVKVVDYFEKGVEKKLLTARIAWVMGLELLFLFGAHLLLISLGLLSSMSALQIVLIIAEFLGGIGLLWVRKKILGKHKALQN